VAGGEGQPRLGGLDPRLARHGQGDLGAGGSDDLGAGDAVGEPAVAGLDHDGVAGLQLVEVGERRAVGGAVPADDGVADLAGLRRPDDAAGPGLEVLDRGALDDHRRVVVEPGQGRDAQHRDAGPELDGDRHRRDVALGRPGRRPGPAAAQLVAEPVLLPGRDEVGDPQLVGAEQQQHHADRDQGLADAAGGGAQCVAHAGTLVTLGSSSRPE
jgi:hypothetical protein